jgi:hypothetical protein
MSKQIESSNYSDDEIKNWKSYAKLDQLQVCERDLDLTQRDIKGMGQRLEVTS